MKIEIYQFLSITKNDLSYGTSLDSLDRNRVKLSGDADV